MILARGVIRPYNPFGSPHRNRPSGVRETLSPRPIRPSDFFSWWAYAVDQASAVLRMGHGGTWKGHLGAAFAPTVDNPAAPHKHRVRARVENNIADGIWSKSPMLSAMQRLMNPRGSHPHEFRILFALVNGHTDPEIVRALVGGCRRDFFEAAAIRAFALVWDRAQEELKVGK